MTENNNPGCLTAFLRFFGLGREPKFDPLPEPAPRILPYRVRDDFLSPAELSFYLVLKNIVGQHLTICPKVRLSDIFFVSRPNVNFSAYNSINQKHVDFLVCDPRTMRPRFGVELDDSSHLRSYRAARDEDVDDIFEAAGLPLVHIPARMGYSHNELNELIAQALTNSKAVDQPEKDNFCDPTDNEAPLCPKCGIPMVLRTAARGRNTGRQFYGCTNFPRCREVLPYQPV